MKRTYTKLLSNLFKAGFILLLLSQTSWAKGSNENIAVKKDYEFHFNFKGKDFSTSVTAANWDGALETAAKSCFKYYKGSRYVSEDEGLDIIDVCANPKRIH